MRDGERFPKVLILHTGRPQKVIIKTFPEPAELNAADGRRRRRGEQEECEDPVRTGLILQTLIDKAFRSGPRLSVLNDHFRGSPFAVTLNSGRCDQGRRTKRVAEYPAGLEEQPGEEYEYR